MASRRNLKKDINYIAGELFMASLFEGVNRETVINATQQVINLIPRVSHTEPGNVKGYYAKIREEIEKQISVVADELKSIEK